MLVAKLACRCWRWLLLASIALWPEIARVTEQGRIAFRRVFASSADSGRMLQPHYRGVDERGRPYTLTATGRTRPGRTGSTWASPRAT